MFILFCWFHFFHSLGKYFWLPLSFEVINPETIPIAYQLTPYSITFTHIHIYTDLWEAEFSASTYNLLVLLCTTDLTVNPPQSSYIPKAALNCFSRLFNSLGSKNCFESSKWFCFSAHYCIRLYTPVLKYFR